MISLFVAGVLCLIAVLHIYWVMGGTWGRAAGVPEVNGHPAFTPSRFATLSVAVAFFCAAVVALRRGGIVWEAFPGSPIHWITVGLGLVFIIRSVGEFRLVGFFKRVHGTRFAHLDTWLYSPLSLLLGLGFLWIATL